MSRAYIVTRNGGTVTKAPINDNKIPIYANETALDADLANIPDNTLAATRGGHDDVIDQMKAYIRDQNELSDYETITLSNTSANPTEMQYDGVLYLQNFTPDAYNLFFSQDNGTTWQKLHRLHDDYAQASLTLLLNKGDLVYRNAKPSGTVDLVAYYKKRDYSNRQ